ncbi:MAG: hypothetical protein IJZ31_08970 [Bacteroidaceae bacterium]|nr:hypothetical protein [Bacteroidaceae bacterium]
MIGNSDDIKKIFQENRDNIAFVIGNGIHSQYKDCSISWEQLLKDLWNDYVGEKRNIPNGTSFTEFYDILELNRFWGSHGVIPQDSEQLILQRSSVKQNVANKFPAKDKYSLQKCIAGVKRLNAPILTTNFDTYISDSVGATPHKLKPIENQYKFTDFYPWNVYYSNDIINNPLNGFAVWHINGTREYPRSIRLGLSDYMGSVERARKMIQGNGLEDYFYGKNQSYWVGYNTWLHIIFNKSLFIFGLGLEENEVFLRWLLIQRTKYCKMYQKSHKGWYVGKNIKPGKRFFLEQLGFIVIDIPDYKTLYQALETL